MIECYQVVNPEVNDQMVESKAIPVPDVIHLREYRLLSGLAKVLVE